MKLRSIFISVIAALTLHTATAKEQPTWLKDAVIYHIYPLSYADSNGDGIGDLNGIRSKLDYIAECGFNCIWLSPCFSSAWEDGGYDITDFYTIDQRFGTNADMKALLDEAHSKGIRVLLDLVAGHTSDKHPWFKASSQAERNKYSDYYIWTEGKSAEIQGPKFVDNKHPRNGYFVRNYFEIQPALNYGYYKPNANHHWEQAYEDPGPTAVRNELKNIISFWCDMGADGFRVDMAGSLVKDDNESHDGVRRLWSDIFAWYNKAYPQNIMMSEWSNPTASLSCGFNIDLLIHNGVGGKIYRPLVCETTDKMAPVPCYFNKKGEGQLRDAIERYTAIYEHFRKVGGYAVMPTCSHDIWRLSRMNRTTSEEQKIVLTMFLTLPTPPVIYYGEEIGMLNLDYAPIKEGSFSSRNRSTCRTPMQWNSGKNAGFSTVEDPQKLYLPVDNSPTFPNVADQLADDNSLLAYVKGLLKLRRETAALAAEGDWRYVGDLDNPYPMIYARTLGNEQYVVVFNPSDRTVEGSIATMGKCAKWVYGNHKSLAKCKTSKDKHTFTMKPVSVAIYKIDR